MFPAASKRAACTAWRQLPLPNTSKLCCRGLARSSHAPTKDRKIWTYAVAGIALTASLGLYNLSTPIYAEKPKKADKQVDASATDAKYPSTCPIGTMKELHYDVSDANIQAATKDFIQLLGADRVLLDMGTRISHSSTEWSPAPHGDLDAYAIVVNPKTTEEVSKICKICHRRNIPMTAFSGGTSLDGTLAATHGGVCLDFKLMNQIIKLRPSDCDVTLQPAISYDDLNDKIAEHDLFFPPDPGPGAMIGGMIAQGCSGTNAYRYGTMKDWVLGLTVVLADGTIIKTRGRPRKSSAGFDLTRLMVGSEGLLGFVTEAHLKLTAKPENARVAVAAFPTTEHAIKTATKIVQDDIPLAAMELLCDTSMRAVNTGGYCDKEYPEIPTIFFKFAGKDEDMLQKQIKQVENFAKEAECKSFEFSQSDDEAEGLWSARKTVLWSLMMLKDDPSDGFLSADTAVPIGSMADAIDATKQKIKESGMTGFCLGHVGDGNFHTAILYPAAKKKEARELINWVLRKAISVDGTVTGEHGIGLEHREMLEEELNVTGVDAMRQIKLALDPKGLLNPGKVFKLNIQDTRK